MLDASFRSKTLMDVANENRDPHDFSFKQDQLPTRVENALARVKGNGSCFHFNTTKRNGREISVPSDFETVLLLRRLNENIRRMTKVRQSDRNHVVSCLKQLCGNGLPFVIAKFDIRKFYASVDTIVLGKECDEHLKTSGTTRHVLSKFLSDLRLAGISGVPAGLALSGTLSEIFLKDFDRAISRSEGVHFYSRYVDDIIIVAAPHLTDFELTERVFENLPAGLMINSSPHKKDFLPLLKKQSKLGSSYGFFEYLGYRFSISDVSSQSNHDKTLSARDLKVDISQSKIRKRKTRFVLSIKQYLRDGLEDDLMDRFLLINSGYSFYDRNSARWLSSGMCNSYPLIDFPSKALTELAMFYRGIFSSPSSKFSAQLALAPISRRNRKRIQYFDANAHVRDKKYVGFNDQKLAQLMGCWRGA